METLCPKQVTRARDLQGVPLSTFYWHEVVKGHQLACVNTQRLLLLREANDLPSGNLCFLGCLYCYKTMCRKCIAKRYAHVE
jgi:hypothetical protein